MAEPGDLRRVVGASEGPPPTEPLSLFAGRSLRSPRPAVGGRRRAGARPRSASVRAKPCSRSVRVPASTRSRRPGVSGLEAASSASTYSRRCSTTRRGASKRAAWKRSSSRPTLAASPAPLQRRPRVPDRRARRDPGSSDRAGRDPPCPSSRRPALGVGAVPRSRLRDPTRATSGGEPRRASRKRRLAAGSSTPLAGRRPRCRLGRSVVRRGPHGHERRTARPRTGAPRRSIRAGRLTPAWSAAPGRSRQATGASPQSGRVVRLSLWSASGDGRRARAARWRRILHSSAPAQAVFAPLSVTR